MPNTSGTGICDEDRTQSHGRRDSIKFGRPTPTLSDWLNELLRSERHRVPGVAPHRPHLGHMTHNGPKQTAKRRIGNEKS